MQMRIWITVLLLMVAAAGCTTKSNARLREQNAFLAGQNAAMQQQVQSEAQPPGVTILGPVQHSHVPWVAGLTLAQAIATANYVGQDQPKQVFIVRHGERAALEAGVLLSGKDVPLEIGDTVELR
jgi:hypothetical protein